MGDLTHGILCIYMFDAIKEKLGFGVGEDEFEGCRAITDDGLCSDDVIGRSHSGKLQYCKSHVPGDNFGSGRIRSVEFYVPETGEIIEKK